jgi:phosphotransferase system enzyme I (PtsI)
MKTKRKKIKCTVISSGISLGYSRLVLPGDTEIAEMVIPSSRVKLEIDALDKAIEETAEELHELRESAGKKMGGPVAKIFDAQLLMARDIEFLRTVKEEITKTRRNAGFVYNKLVKKSISPLKKSPDEYMRQMAVDIQAVGNRVMSHLAGFDRSDDKFQPNTILVGKMFTPGEVLSCRQRKAIGFVVGEGGSNSHMALIARGLMMPVVLSKNAILDISDNCRLIIDGIKGEIIVNPTDEDWSEYQKLKKGQGPASLTRIKRLTIIPPKTRDGHQISIGANLALPGPADDILSEKNIPIGLYRTEFLYLANNKFPSEDDQYEIYKQVAEKYKTSSVVMRTFDLGYDKLNTNGFWPREDNPALGWRGVRAMLEMEEMFKAQIRAILRASINKNLKIMLPMISVIPELEKAKKLIQQVKFKLRRDNIPFDENIELGIMIEVPSAAMTAETLAEKVDFMSIGTNDLTQYAMAADRMNFKVANIYSVFHPSVLKLIEMTVKACKSKKIHVSICGEMAGDLLALPFFIGLGVDMLSMNPVKIFDMCRLVKKIDHTMAVHLTSSVLSSSTQKEVLGKLQNYKMELEKRRASSKRK